MKVGIVGLPGAGKTTVFQVLTGVVSVGTGKQDASMGMTRVPDQRIDVLTGMFKPKKTMYAQVEVVDIAGRTTVQAQSGPDDPRARSRNLTLLINNMRNVDALINVVRAFPSLEHGEAKPLSAASSLDDELILADMAIVEGRVERLESQRRRSAEEEQELGLMKRLAAGFGEGLGIRQLGLNDDEIAALRGYGLLSLKPVVVAVNVDEGQYSSAEFPHKPELEAWCVQRNLPLIVLCAEIEAEIAELPEEERAVFMEEYSITRTGVEQVSQAVYGSLGMISFLTVGEDEVRAWPIKQGTSARQAAGTIHTDIERGFIRAEIVAYDHLMKVGSYAAARAAGLFRLEGRDYIMQDGDIVNFRFSPAR